MLTPQRIAKLKDITPTPYEYREALKIVKDHEQMMNTLLGDVAVKKLYVHLVSGFYAIGRFDGWEGDRIKILIGENHWIVIDTDSVYTTRQDFMTDIHSNLFETNPNEPTDTP